MTNTIDKQTLELLEHSKRLARERQANWRHGVPANAELEQAHLAQMRSIQDTLSGCRPDGRQEQTGNIFDRIAMWLRKINI